MINVVFIKNGEIAHYGSPGADDDFIDGETYDGYLCKIMNVDIDLSSFSKVKYWSYDTNSWKDRVPLPTSFYDWVETEWVLNRERLITEIRRDRDTMLQRTDFTQLPDSPFSDEEKEKFKIYRQELRDFMAVVGEQDIDDIIQVAWPTLPT